MRPQWKASLRRRGVTFIEAVIAMVILGIAVVALFGMMVHSWSIMRRTDEFLYVNRVLESTLEATRSLSYAQLDDWQTTASVSGGYIAFDTAYPVSSIYGNQLNPGVTDDATFGMKLSTSEGRVYIEDVGSPEECLKKVTIEVNWRPYAQGRAMAPKKHSIVTYVSQMGITRKL